MKVEIAMIGRITIAVLFGPTAKKLIILDVHTNPQQNIMPTIETLFSKFILNVMPTIFPIPNIIKRKKGIMRRWLDAENPHR